MRNIKLIVIATTIATLAVATISVALAHTYGGSQYYGGMMAIQLLTLMIIGGMKC